MVALARVADIRVSSLDKKSVEDQVPVRLCNYTDVYYRDSIGPDQEFMSATATPEQVSDFSLLPGDVVITKDSETAEDIGVATFISASATDLVCGYHLAILRPKADVIDGRFLYWSVSSDQVRRQFAANATGVTRFGLRTDAIGNATLSLPSLTEQRVIAGFLDRETHGIDTLTRSLHAQIELLAERRHALVAQVLSGEYQADSQSTAAA